MRPLTSCCVGLFVCFACGCVQTVRDLATTAGSAAGSSAGASAPSGFVNGLVELEKPPQQQRLESVARSPGVQEATRSLGMALSRGTVDEFVTLAGTATTQPVDGSAADGASRSHSSGASDSLTRFAQRSIDPIVAQIVRSALRAGDAPDAQAEAHAIAEAIGSGFVTGTVRASRENSSMIEQLIREQLGPAIGDTVRQQLKPAMDVSTRERLMTAVHDLLQQEIVPAIRQAWDQGAADTLLIPTRPEMRPAVVQNAQNLSAGAAFGSREAMIQFGLLSNSGGLTIGAKVLLYGVVVVLALIGVAAAAMIIVLAMLAASLRRSQSPRINPTLDNGAKSAA